MFSFDLAAFHDVGAWTDAFGFRDTVDRDTVEAYWGTSADDFMLADGGNSTRLKFQADFYGHGGNDTLVGSGLGQIIDGGDGDDTIDGLGGNDTLTGGAGNDSIKGSGGNDSIDGGGGNDSIDGGGGDDTLTGGAGNDSIMGGEGYDTVDFADGNAAVHVDLAGNSGNGFWLDAFGGTDTIERDTVEAYRGTSGDDFMQGDGGWREWRSIRRRFLWRTRQ